MAERDDIFYDDDADLALLDGKTIAILGYGPRVMPTRSTSRTRAPRWSSG